MKQIRYQHHLLWLAIPLLQIGCAFRPVENTAGVAEIETPDSWENSVEQPHTSNQSISQQRWLHQFGDGALIAFVDSALSDSYSLKAGMAQLAQSEALVRLKGGSKYPSLGINLSHGTQENYSQMVGVVRTDINTLGLSSAWEIDLWGKVRDEQAAAFADLQAAGFQYADIQLTLESTIAKTWFGAIEAKNQWRLARENRDSFLDNLETLEDRYRKGLIQAFDLRLFRVQATANEATVKQREVTYKTLVMQLQSLASQIPNSQFELPSQLPEVLSGVPFGVPSDLLTNRPDVRASERQLAAAVGSQSSANKNWLPSFRITASWGTAASEFGQLFGASKILESILGGVTAPLLQGGRLDAERDLAKAQVEVRVNQFKQVVLEAIREVETALMREQLLQGIEEVLAESAEEAEKAEQQAWDLYNRGLINITTVLDAQRNSDRAQGDYLSIKSQRLQNRIDLHVALGGSMKQPDISGI